MKNKPKHHRRIVISQCHRQDDDFQKLYRIFYLTLCPGMRYEVFEKYYQSAGLQYIDVSFFYSEPDTIIGFCAAAFYKTDIGGKPVTIARSAIGFLQQHQGGALSKRILYGKYMRYKWQHPWQRLILTIYASNPFVYRMVCKYTGIVYPRPGCPVPDGIIALKNQILRSNNLLRREKEPFVVRINFEVEKSDALQQKATESTNPSVRFFMQKTGLQQCFSLLLIIPVSFSNILLCMCLLLYYYSIAKAGAAAKYLYRAAKKQKNRLTCWLNRSSAPTTYADRKTM